MNKPAVESLRERGVKLRKGDINGPEAELAKALHDIDIVISCVGALQQLDQVYLINAANKAGMKRSVPCGFVTATPARGIMRMRDQVCLGSLHLVAFLVTRLCPFHRKRVCATISSSSDSHKIIDVGW